MVSNMDGSQGAVSALYCFIPFTSAAPSLKNVDRVVFGLLDQTRLALCVDVEWYCIKLPCQTGCGVPTAS